MIPVCSECRALGLPLLLQPLHYSPFVTERFQREEGSLGRSPCRCLLLAAATSADNCPALILAALSRRELVKSNKALRKSCSFASWLRSGVGIAAGYRASAPWGAPTPQQLGPSYESLSPPVSAALLDRRCEQACCREGPRQRFASKLWVYLLLQMPPLTCKIELKGPLRLLFGKKCAVSALSLCTSPCQAILRRCRKL